jgi:S-ribosylhomocysteine lyase
MNKIPSFTVDHIKLLRGVYVSRKDNVNGTILTTFDLRMKRPNMEPVMNTAEIHAIEHLAATYLRNHAEYGEKIIYFGPMGCRTGFYLIVTGDYSSDTILPLVKETFDFILKYDGEIPGASAKDCGNHLDMNLPMAKFEANKYLDSLEHITMDQLTYPQ